MISSVMSEQIDIIHLSKDAGHCTTISSIGACECGFVVIIRMDGNLMLTRITIKATKEGIICKPL